MNSNEEEVCWTAEAMNADLQQLEAQQVNTTADPEFDLTSLSNASACYFAQPET